MYDLLIVGAGITAATLAAALKGRMKICVIDCRNHLGGNCFDRLADGTLIHQYGPHIFHCPSPRIRAFLDAYTRWTPYTHKVIAEIEYQGSLHYVPFPYSRQTIRQLGCELTDAEIIDVFFRGYSQKMWGMAWEELPQSVRRRIPKEVSETPVYHRDPFVALPSLGYTHMMQNMLDGVEMILGAPSSEWTRIRAANVVYTGRPDMIPEPGDTNVTIGQRAGLQLDFRTLDIEFAPETWCQESVSLHACSMRRHWTRKTCYARMTGGQNLTVSTEIPRQATAEELTPYYPIETETNLARLAGLRAHIGRKYPHLHLAGRLGSYRYFDMYQAVGQALTLAQRFGSEISEKAGVHGNPVGGDRHVRLRDSSSA